MSRDLRTVSDADVRVMFKIEAALRQCSSPRALRATLEYFWARYVDDDDADQNVRAIFERRVPDAGPAPEERPHGV